MKEKKEKFLLSMEHERQGKKLMANWVKVCIIALCFLSDTITFYILYDNMFAQAQWLNYFVAVLCAISINLFPMLINYILSNRELTSFEKIMAAIFGAAFLMVLVVCFIIRLNSKAALFADISAMNSSAETTAEVGNITYTTAQTATSVLMACLPGITSLIVFGLTYSNPRQSYINVLKNQQIILQDKMDNLETNIGLINQELAEHDLEKYDYDRYKALLDTIENIKKYSMIVSRRVLAQELGTAVACTRLMEENSLKSIITNTLANSQMGE